MTSIPNDGSFLEQFLKSQKDKVEARRSAEESTGTAAGSEAHRTREEGTSSTTEARSSSIHTGQGQSADNVAAGGAAAQADVSGYDYSAYYAYYGYGGYPYGYGYPPPPVPAAGAAGAEAAAGAQQFGGYPPPAYPGYPGFPGGGYPPPPPPVHAPPGVGAGGGGAGGAEGSGGNRSVWLGNLPYGITEEELRAEFAPYGMLRDVKILTQKNCAFLHYFDPADAERALMAARGKRLRGQEIRVGWGKPDPAEGRERDERTGDGNPPSRNLWVGNLHPNVTEELLHQTFSPFGRIEHIKLLHQKNCAFILMSSMEEATNARRTMMGRELLGRPLRINYGKQDGPPGRQGIGMSSSVLPAQPPPPQPPPPPPQQSSEPAPPFAAPPANDTLRQTIDKFIEYLHRNGPMFERSVREKEQNNPRFSFLFGGEGSDYFRWRNYALKHGLDPDVPPPRAEPPAAAAPPSWQQPPPSAAPAPSYPPPPSQPPLPPAQPPAYPPPPYQSYQQPPPPPPPRPSSPPREASPPPSGGPPAHSASSSPPSQPVHLGPSQEAELDRLLSELLGTRESIKSAKDWLIQYLDAAEDIAAAFSRKLRELARAPGQEAADRRLYLIYLINDLLHFCLKKRGEDVSRLDPFSATLLSRLPTILRAAYVGQDAETQERLLRVVRLWGSRQIFDGSEIDLLERQMTLAEEPAPAAPPAKRPRGDSYDGPPPPSSEGAGGDERRSRRSRWD